MKTLLLCVAACLAAFVIASAGEPEAGSVPGRYQILVAPAISKDSEPVLFRIDTQTGKTWVYDLNVNEFFTKEDATKESDPSKPSELADIHAIIDALWKAGTPPFKHPSWREIGETPAQGFFTRSKLPELKVPDQVEKKIRQTTK